MFEVIIQILFVARTKQRHSNHQSPNPQAGNQQNLAVRILRPLLGQTVANLSKTTGQNQVESKVGSGSV
jgi:hypothetical protein